MPLECTGPGHRTQATSSQQAQVLQSHKQARCRGRGWRREDSASQRPSSQKYKSSARRSRDRTEGLQAQYCASLRSHSHSKKQVHAPIPQSSVSDRLPESFQPIKTGRVPQNGKAAIPTSTQFPKIDTTERILVTQSQPCSSQLPLGRPRERLKVAETHKALPASQPRQGVPFREFSLTSKLSTFMFYYLGLISAAGFHSVYPILYHGRV
jgi:hypothetical protein